MAKKRSKASAIQTAAVSGQRLIPPEDGVTVRMYRVGHGDCFLLAFAGETEPIYVLIDCGYKPGSPKYIHTKIGDIAKNIREATGGHLHVAVITHEHQDHVNGITQTHFEGISIGETWLAWTEDPDDEIANTLRVRFKDKLVGLVAARNRLGADAGSEPFRKRLDDFLEFELGWDSEAGTPSDEMLLAAADNPDQSLNKKSMKLFKERAEKQPPRYICPHEDILTIPGAKKLRIFALGPPHDVEQIEDLDPQGDEAFPLVALAAASPENSFRAALNEDARPSNSPFSKRFSIPLKDAAGAAGYGEFFSEHYGVQGQAESPVMDNGAPRTCEVPTNPGWRRIELEWLYSAEQLALDISDYTNNSSLVLAFELEAGGKVLLFAADAQRGNWVSWGKKAWKDGDKTITARELLARTVLYKVGHHGSHNATLNGPADSEHPSLGWMAQGEYGQEFTAMITAVRAWAETQKGWDHPRKSIKDALLKKAGGRVFQTDTDFEQMGAESVTATADWKRFQAHARGNQLYFDYTILSTP